MYTHALTSGETDIILCFERRQATRRAKKKEKKRRPVPPRDVVVVPLGAVFYCVIRARDYQFFKTPRLRIILFFVGFSHKRVMRMYTCTVYARWEDVKERENTFFLRTTPIIIDSRITYAYKICIRDNNAR